MNENSGTKTPLEKKGGLIFSIAGSIIEYLQRLVRPNVNQNTVLGALEELIEEHPHQETPIVEEQRNLLQNILNLRRI